MKKILVVCSLVFISIIYAAAPGYHVTKKVHLGGDGSWDYLIVDNTARQLYVSHGTQVVVVDLETDNVVAEIKDTPGVHGIALVPELNRGFISCGEANKAIIFDLKTLKILGEVETGAHPDAIRYDSASKRVFVYNADSNDATVIDAASGEIAGTIVLGGAPEFSRTDGKGKVYVNLEDVSEVVEIDSRKLAITRRFSIEPTGMGFDIAHHHIFSGCGNKIMTVLDTETGKVIATVPIGEECDGVGFDPATGLVFCSNGEGTLTVVQETSPGKFEVAETVATQWGARTMTIDPKTHDVYLPTSEFAPPAAPTRDASEPQRTMIKDSFSVLVVGK
jgi:DNA-binding beta-propeller fold protein YncE